MRKAPLVFASFLAALGAQETPNQAISPAAAKYLESTLAIMQEHFYQKARIDWPELRRETLAQAGGAQSPVDTYPAIRFALAKLGDHHSYLQLTPELTRQETARQPKLADPSAMPKPYYRPRVFPFPSPFRTRRVPESAMIPHAPVALAIIVVPSFAGSRGEVDEYATNVQRAIAERLAEKPCGWVVDLRGNGGGNIWAMLAGVGPILGEGNLGKSPRYYENGKAGVRDDKENPDYAKSNAPAVHLASAPPVAVLIDRDTGSSGEGIAIDFEARPETRLFGEFTFGAATATFPYELSDGATLYLVIGAMRDRSGKEYPDGVPPDQEVVSEATIITTDPVVHAASEWLAGRAACRVHAK
jgi:hypothetical protein